MPGASETVIFFSSMHIVQNVGDAVVDVLGWVVVVLGVQT